MTASALAAAQRGAALKARVCDALKRRFFLRFHVSLILLFTFCAGLVTTRAMLWLGVDVMWVRYLVAMLAAYGAFLLGVRLWLAYIGASATAGVAPSDSASGGDNGSLDVPLDFVPGAGGDGASLPFRAGGGGEFAGGGASDSFAAAGNGGDVLPAVGGSGGSSGSGGGWGIDLGDGEGLLVLLLALLVLLAVVGGAAWLIWIGPEVLVEAAFEAMLAGGLVKSLHDAGSGGWVGRVLWKTLLPFGLVTAAAVAFAAVGQSAYPDARTFRDVVRAAWLGEEADPQLLANGDDDSEIATLDDELHRLGPEADIAKMEDRSRAADLLQRRAQRLARLGRVDEMLASYDRSAAQVRPDDPARLQHQAADALRLKAFELGAHRGDEAAFAAFSTFLARYGTAADPELQWRSAWVTLQQAMILERREEGGGLALMRAVALRHRGASDNQLKSLVADAWYMQGLADIWRAKKGGNAAGSRELVEAIGKFEAALAAAPVGSANAAEALAGLAYARFLAGDADAARATLARIAREQAGWVRSSVLSIYVENRVLPVDAEFRRLYEQQLKAGDG